MTEPPDTYAEITFESAMAEVNEIVTALESDEISVDKMLDSAARARSLLNWCDEKLRSVDEELHSERIATDSSA